MFDFVYWSCMLALVPWTLALVWTLLGRLGDWYRSSHERKFHEVAPPFAMSRIHKNW